MTDLGCGRGQLSDRTLLRDGGDSDPCTLIDRLDRPRGLDRHATNRFDQSCRHRCRLLHIHPINTGKLVRSAGFEAPSDWVGIRPTGRDCRANLEVRRDHRGVDLAGHRVRPRRPSALDDRVDPAGHRSDSLPPRRYRP